MSDFSAFFAQNKIQHDNLKYAASKDFVDKDGKPLEWEIRRLDADEDDKLRKACMRQVKTVGRAPRMEMDTNLYIAKLVSASVVYPNLNDKELQDSYKVMGAETLVKKMLNAGEYAELSSKVAEHNGFDTDMNDLVEEAKN